MNKYLLFSKGVAQWVR